MFEDILELDLKENTRQFIETMLLYKGVAKSITTFETKFIELMELQGQKVNLIHPGFRQHGTAS